MKLTEIIRATRRLMCLSDAVRIAGREARGLESVHDRALWQQRQASRMLRALEVRVDVHGNWPRSGLLVGNHLGYLDILVIAAQLPCVFVSKSEVRSWPFIGNLLAAAGTILTDRNRRHSARQTSIEIRRILEQGLPVVVFPEGTSSDGSQVLHFRTSLLEAASDLAWSVHPMAITYQGSGGNPGRDICYWGDDTFLPHLARLAGTEPLRASLAIGEHEVRGLPRKEAAAVLYDEVLRLLESMRSGIAKKSQSPTDGSSAGFRR